MNREQFTTVIYAPREKIWRVLWGKDTYPAWTAVFGEGSRVETDWKEGSRVLFLGATNEGMVARIAEMRENEYMSFEHLGMIDENGKEDLESDKVKDWVGAKENYHLVENDGKTELTVELDLEESHRSFFTETFPKALQIVKDLSENKFTG